MHSSAETIVGPFEGVGCLHVPAANAKGFLPVPTFYTLSSRTTVIDESDLVKAAKVHTKDIRSNGITEHKDAGTFAHHAKHRKSYAKDIVVHGTLIHDKCYTGALIPPEILASDAHASPGTSSEFAMEQDPEFAEQCRRAAILAIHGYHEVESTQLHEEMSKLPAQFHQLPFHEHIHSNMPIARCRTSFMTSMPGKSQRLFPVQRPSTC